jgi:[ribosomal protein S5]-alanine N-acetyltransferase
MEEFMIETISCKLIRIQDSDYEDLKRIYTNHQVRKYLGGVIGDENLLRSKFKEILMKSSVDYYWVIRSIIGNEFIGVVILDKHHDDQNIEVSYQLFQNGGGQGLLQK